MKRLVAVICLMLVIHSGTAQEVVPSEEAQKMAALLLKQTAKLDNLQFKAELDATKAFALKKEQVGALVIPSKKLSEEVLKKTGDKVTPVGQLWFRKLTVISKDQPIPNEKLRIVTITVRDEEHPVPLFLLGVRKKGSAALELVFFAKEKEPLLCVPLKKVEVKQDLPVEMEGKGEDQKGTLTLNILGKYQASISVAYQEQ